MYQPKGGKRIKVSDTGAFTSSSNADISDDEVREVRPTGQKAAKRKGNEKKDTHARFIEISERKVSALEKLVAIKKKEAEDNRMTKYMDYLIMDTSHMTHEQKKDHENLFGRRGLLPLQKCTAAMRMLAYGAPADYVDEYVRIGETTAIECLVNFVRGVNDIFGTEYLSRPNAGDICRLLQIGEVRGFPSMLGSIDCMHWEWKNCPVAWKGQFTRGDHGRPTIMFEAVASQDLWIWHAFFGVPGSNNDLNVLNQSPLFTEILQGQAPRVEFTINGTQYSRGTI
ncbi:uncharacterized protein LOC133777681 [Humulus lupulus]|uniref:uncharacterized protein LOC133777681 n=1 Tax=Humulus lupulus TaxID=3486 RepID=UPI002B415A25|nr:uncharacterized protein LOC133777681 [Humulus lupulus]